MHHNVVSFIRNLLRVSAALLLTVSLTITLLTIAEVASAQWLDLSDDLPPPELGGATFAASLAAELEREIAESEVLTSSDDIDLAELTSSSYRHLAHALLLADSGGDLHEASALIVRGMNMHADRNHMDVNFERIARWCANAGDDRAAAEAAMLLREFCRLVARLTQDAKQNPLRMCDMESSLALLDQAMALFLQEAGTGLQTDSPPAFHELRMNVRMRDAFGEHGAQLDEHLSDIADALERGWAFAEWRPRIMRWHELLRSAPEYIAELMDADWLEDESRSQGAQRLERTLSAFRDPLRRASGEKHLLALRAETRVLHAITALQQSTIHAVNVDPLRASLLRLREHSSAAEDHDRLTERLIWLAAIVDRMNQLRRAAPADFDAQPARLDVRREVLRIRSVIAKSAFEAERAMLASLEHLTANPRAANADPALATLLTDFLMRAEDLSRLDRIERWTQVVTLIHPESVPAFSDRTRELARMLADPVLRVEAASVMDRIENDMSRYWPMPFESELRRRSPVARDAAANLNQELLEEITRLRAQWARELAGGEFAGEASRRLQLVWQLTKAMEDMAELMRVGDDLSRLSGDALWVPQTYAACSLERILPRLRRAVQAAIEDNEQQLLRHLRATNRFGAPARLIGRLIAAAGEAGSAHEQDPSVASFCRYAAELAYAAGHDHQHVAESLQEYLDRLAAIILDDMNE